MSYRGVHYEVIDGREIRCDYGYDGMVWIVLWRWEHMSGWSPEIDTVRRTRTASIEAFMDSWNQPCGWNWLRDKGDVVCVKLDLMAAIRGGSFL
jgi:hypothetical protein